MDPKPHIHQLGDHLYRISLPVPIPGFDEFISAWVSTADPVAVVDVGPTSTSAHLLSGLAELGVIHLDMILLTHIHIDHAGGIGPVAAQFPHAAVVCHPKGLGHLADPERLWQGSLKTLGKIAEAYGPITPVAPGQLIGADTLEHPKITAVETPGHAAHHCSYLTQGVLFAGEACGVSLPMDDGVYLRPATPPRFFLETSLESLDRLIQLNPRQICYGHVGWRSNAMELMAAHRDQLIRWKEMVRPFFKRAATDTSVAMRDCAQYLVDTDPLLGGLNRMPPAVRERERGFLHNSLRGYWGYLENMS